MWGGEKQGLQTLAQHSGSRERTLVETSEPRGGSETSVTLAQLGCSSPIWTEMVAEMGTDRTVVGIQAQVVDADRERDQDMPGRHVH